MRKIIIECFLGLLIVLTPVTVKAQLFNNTEIFQNVKLIKGEYYNGTGGKGYWSLDYVDSIGRIIKKENYFKKKLMSREKIEYDDNNNVIFLTSTFDVNNPTRTNTISKYEYKYSKNRIIYQYCKLSDNDSTVIKLIENKGDSIFAYQEKSYYFRPRTGKTDVFEKIYTLKYRNNLLIYNEILNKEDNSKEIKIFEYYDNARLKRRVIERIPKPEFQNVYTGGPGSDDEYYKYEFDSKGKIKKFYRMVNEKKYKIAVYCYKL